MNGHNIACITPREAKLLVKYLDAVDDSVTARLSSGFNPHEDHLTALLCEMLDDNLTALNHLSFSMTELRDELAKDPRKLTAALSIETRKYPPHIESKLTSSDIGIIVIYQDHLVPADSFKRGVLLQAKKLFMSSQKDGFAYSLDNRFESFDFNQLHKLAALELATLEQDRDDPENTHKIYLRDWSFCHYLFYCPRLEAYDEPSREEIHRHLIPIGNIFDHAKGWHLYEFASNPNRHVPGLIVASVQALNNKYIELQDEARSPIQQRPSPPCARDIFQVMWTDSHPLSWFLIYDMLLGNKGSSSPATLALVCGNRTNQNTETPILPRYVVTVQVEHGTAHG